MRELFIIGLLLLSSVSTAIMGIRIFNFVIYDKIIHATIGLLFGVIYFINFPKDHPIPVSILFAIVYEIFVYVVFGIILLFLMRDFQNLQSPVDFFGNFLKRYLELDEWLDVIATFTGVFSGKYVKSKDGFL